MAEHVRGRKSLRKSRRLVEGDAAVARGRRVVARVLLALTGAAVVAAVIYVAVGYRPWLLSAYTVRGMSYLKAEEVLAAAGLTPGRNLFTADLAAAEKRLNATPRIRRARVARRLPAEVVITIEEREAAAAVIINGELYKAAADGVVLEPMAAGYEDVPVLTGVAYRVGGEAPGRRLAGPDVRETLAALAALAAADTGIWAAVDYADVKAHALVCERGTRVVKYGAGFNERTARRLRRVWAETASETGPLVYDVRFGKDVIVTGARAGGGRVLGGDAQDDGPV